MHSALTKGVSLFWDNIYFHQAPITHNKLTYCYFMGVHFWSKFQRMALTSKSSKIDIVFILVCESHYIGDSCCTACTLHCGSLEIHTPYFWPIWHVVWIVLNSGSNRQCQFQGILIIATFHGFQMGPKSLDKRLAMQLVIVAMSASVSHSLSLSVLPVMG